MNIGELFINLGIKGSEKTIGALTNIKEGLGKLTSTSLEAKAALIGAAYAFDRLMAASGQYGTNLTNFAAVINMSRKELQQYEYVARQVGSTNEAMDSTFLGLQQQILKKTTTGQGMSSLFMMGKVLGGIPSLDRYKDNPKAFFEEVIVPYAKKEKSKSWLYQNLSELGFSKEIIRGLEEGKFNAANYAKAPFYSDASVKQLDKNRAALSNLATKVEMAFGNFNAKYGGPLIKDLGIATDKILKLGEAFVRLGESAKVLKAIGLIFEGWGKIFDGIRETIEMVQDKNKREQVGDTAKGVGLQMLRDMHGEGNQVFHLKDLFDWIMHGSAQTAPAGGGNVTIQNQNLNFQHDGRDHGANKASHKDAAKAAHGQMMKKGNQ